MTPPGIKYRRGYFAAYQRHHSRKSLKCACRATLLISILNAWHCVLFHEAFTKHA